jgi:hypothetical protein
MDKTYSKGNKILIIQVFVAIFFIAWLVKNL